MKKETLKQLIELVYTDELTVLEYKEKVLKIIDLYENDTYEPIISNDCITDYIKYGYDMSYKRDSGICNCNVGNERISNPNKDVVNPHFISKLI
jgi:hypothetical protein